MGRIIVSTIDVNYPKYRFTIPRPLPWEYLSIVSSLSSVSSHDQEERTKYLGDEIHTNVDECLLHSRGFVYPMLPPAKANLPELVQCGLDSLTIEVSLVCQVPIRMQAGRREAPDSSNAMIVKDITLLGPSALYVADAHGLVNHPDTLPHFIIVQWCCQATLLLPNPHGICCPLADTNSGDIGPCGTVACAQVVECARAYAKVCLLYHVTKHVAST